VLHLLVILYLEMFVEIVLYEHFDIT